MEEEANQEEVTLLQSEVEKLQALLKELEDERDQLIKRTAHLKSAEDRKVKNWKLIQEATKFFGVSVRHSDRKSCTFNFHPMWGARNQPTYSMTVKLNKEGYTIGQCYLPESIQLSHLDDSIPLNNLVWDISYLVDCYVQRQQQIVELEELLGDRDDRSVSYTPDQQKVIIRVKVADEETSWFMLNIILEYGDNETLPNNVSFDVEGDRTLTEQDESDFERHCQPFYQLSLINAFQEAF